MKSIARLTACLPLCVGALLAALAAHAAPVTYTWTGFYKDTGMAQFPAMSNAIVNGQYTLYLGSQNVSTGPGKVNTFNAQGALQGTFSTPANDPSVDFFSALTSPVGAAAKGLVMGTDSAHVYLLDGSTFTDITPTAAEFAGNRGVYSGIEYSNRIFIGTGGSAGSAQVWAWDGTAWTQQSLPGFPGTNSFAWCMTVYNNALYLGTVDFSQAAQVWKYDGNAWSLMTIPGFSASNYAVASMAVYNGKLYIGTGNTLGSGAEIWSYNGSSWTKLTGFGRNDTATSMALYNGALYIGTSNYAQGGVGQLWAYDGTSLTQATAPASFGGAGNSGIVSLAAANGVLYAGTSNSSGAELWSVSASGGANLPGALSGLWWNPNESGWGIDFTQRGGNIFAAWYTYDSAGNPKWYVASNCTGASGASGTCSGALYQVNGPAFFGVAFDTSKVNVTQAGNISVTFQDVNNGSMTYTVAGQTRTVAITRQNVAFGSGVASVDYTDLWWNPNESGWGMVMAQQTGNIFLAWYVYQSNGQPTWYVASNCSINGDTCSGSLYATTGPAFGPTFDPTQVHVTTVGTIFVNFTDPNNAVLTYAVNGISGTKNITRELF